MKYVGNFSDWIKPEYIEYILNNPGTTRPGGGPNPDVSEFKKAKEAGYDLSSTMWHIYESHTFPFTVTLPFEHDGDFIWWAIKMTPGQQMPFHRDPHTSQTDFRDVKRYWMTFQDYEPGHIFMYDTQVLTNYKKGDVYEYPDAQEIHGACNIGYNPRITFHFSTFYRV